MSTGEGRLVGRTALITGASRGIGAAAAAALGRDGARVALVARDLDALAEVASGLDGDPVVIAADLADADAPRAVAAQALDGLGRVDILVNNAAHAARLPTDDLTAGIVDAMLAVNVRAPLLLVRSLLPHFRQRGSGCVINVTSVSGLVGTPRRAAYAASKGAMDAATRSLAMELGPAGIRVNSVAPGVVDTALWAANKAVPGVVRSVEELTPLGRWAQPGDVADVIAWLASDEARFVTGQTIAADGGMGTTMNLYGGPV